VKLNDAMEAATRFAESNLAGEQGIDAIGRARAAQEVTNNYGRIGNSMRAVSMMTPFYNAAWQAVSADVVAFKKHPGRYAYRATVSIAVPTAILYAVNRKDPEYAKIAQWRKDFFWMVPLGTGPRHPWAPIPKPHLPGMIFGTLLERVLTGMEKKDPAALEGFLSAVSRQGLTGTEGVPLPTAAQVPMELWGNRAGWTGRKIVPAGREGLPVEFQTQPYTGPTATVLGKAAGIAPAKIEHGVQGFTGGVGMGTLRLVDILGRAAGVYGPAPKGISEPYAPENLPGVRRFYTRRPDRPEFDEKEYARYQKGESLVRARNLVYREGTPNEQRAFESDHGADLREYMKIRGRLQGQFQHGGGGGTRLNDIRRQVGRRIR
jgi:hypothetical protein